MTNLLIHVDVDASSRHNKFSEERDSQTMMFGSQNRHPSFLRETSCHHAIMPSYHDACIRAHPILEGHSCLVHKETKTLHEDRRLRRNCSSKKKKTGQPPETRDSGGCYVSPAVTAADDSQAKNIESNPLFFDFYRACVDVSGPFPHFHPLGSILGINSIIGARPPTHASRPHQLVGSARGDGGTATAGKGNRP